jgi:hypothetical protein
VIHVRREIERDLAASLTALPGYRRARWRAVILYGMAGIGKTAMARALADDDQVKRAFRDGVAWADGSRDPEEEVMRLCLGFDLERTPGERWIECWRRWTSAAERRLLLIIDDAISAERLPPLIAWLGPQVVALITTQQGAEIRGEVERWLPAEAVMEVGVHGLAPAEGRTLVEAVAARTATDAEWGLVQEFGELVGWQPEALRLASIEGRETGWAGTLGELQADRMPWAEVNRSVMRQWARLLPDQREWLAALVRGATPGVPIAVEEAAQVWQVEPAVAERRLWILERNGLLDSRVAEQTQGKQWSVARVVQRSFGQLTVRKPDRHSGGQRGQSPTRRHPR